MAKKKKRRPLRDQDPKFAADGSETSWQAATIIHPNPSIRAKHRACKTTAHERTTSVASTTIGDRFHALPTELRAHIFSFLLVQPVKWDVHHEQECPRRKSDEDITPKIWCRDECATDVYIVTWRKSNYTYVFSSPWRSRWAEEPRNPYVCSVCYDGRLRAGPVPRTKSLPCLCARRQELQILLVCKQWYHEAATVLYTHNTFAFEDHTTFTAFVANMNTVWRDKLSKVSLLSWVEGQETSPSAANRAFNQEHGLPSDVTWEEYFQWPRRSSPGLWALLRTLPSLSYLELDASFLTCFKSVRCMLRLGLRNLKQVRFVNRIELTRDDLQRGTPTVWPAFAGRSLIVGGFAEEVARAIKGQRQLRLKDMDAVKRSTQEVWMELAKSKAS